jgi:hypothetical protein
MKHTECCGDCKLPLTRSAAPIQRIPQQRRFVIRSDLCNTQYRHFRLIVS